MKNRRNKYIQAADFIAFDTKTATLDLSSLCQIGYVVVIQNKIIHRESILVQPPGNNYAVGNSCLHGIDAGKTKDEPSFFVVWAYIRELFESYKLVAHNAAFNASVLRDTLRYYKIKVPKFSYDCTYRMSGLSLADLSDALEISRMNNHDALSNAEACAKAYIKLKQGVKPNHSLIRTETEGVLVSG